MSETIFAKIIRKEIPAKIAFESERILAFHDINPQAPVHILIIPKEFLAKISDYTPSDHALILSEMIETANLLAKEYNIAESGYRLVFNCNPEGGQDVYHLHLHLLGGRKMNWPPG